MFPVSPELLQHQIMLSFGIDIFPTYILFLHTIFMDNINMYQPYSDATAAESTALYLSIVNNNHSLLLRKISTQFY